MTEKQPIAQTSRYEFQKGRSSKFWEITIEGASYRITYGRIGSTGQSLTKKWPDAATAWRNADDLKRSKEAEGYKLVAGLSSGASSATPGIITIRGVPANELMPGLYSDETLNLSDFGEVLCIKARDETVDDEFVIKNIEDIGGLEGVDIKELNLEGHKLRIITRLHSRTLEVLNLSFNAITRISGLDLPNLKLLNLAGNKLKRIEGLEKCINLETLVLDHNSIAVLENLNLPKLQKLSIINNKITKIEGTVKLEELKELCIGWNFLSDVLVISGACPFLKVLDLSCNRLVRPDGIAGLGSLERLYLAGNQLESIDGLEDIRNLKVLVLSDNRILNAIHLDKLSKLREIFLDGNGIASLSSFSPNSSVANLHLERNNLQTLDGLRNFSAVEQLWLVGNEISDTTELANLPRLRKCDLSHNPVRYLHGLESAPNYEIYLEDTRIPQVEFGEAESLELQMTLYHAMLERGEIPTHDQFVLRYVEGLFEHEDEVPEFIVTSYLGLDGDALREQIKKWNEVLPLALEGGKIIKKHESSKGEA